MGLSTVSRQGRKKPLAKKLQKRKRKPRSLRPVAPVTALNSRSHNEAEIIAMGRHVWMMGAGKGPMLLDVGSARPKRGLMRKLLGRSRASGKNSLKLTSKDFGDKWRGLMPYQDELFSTASARGFIQGILDGDKRKKMSSRDEPLIVNAVELISQLRVPTSFVGYSTKNSSMQHPTTAGMGMFADSKGDAASLHSQLDAARAEQVGKEMRTASMAKSASTKSIVYAGMRRAISFTLNEMMAPIAAGDIRKYSIRGPTSGALSPDQKKQMAAREELKKVFVDLGGVLRAKSKGRGGLSRGRDWTPGQGQDFREPSPMRSQA